MGLEKYTSGDFMNDIKNGAKNVGGIFGKLVTKANKELNSKKATKIKKALIGWGALACVIGGLCIIGGLIISVIPMMGDLSDSGMMAGTFIGTAILWFLAVPFIGLGSSAVQAGLAIVIAGVGAKFVDVQNYCPTCGDKIESDEMFCNKCGATLKANKLCSCGTQNEFDDKFCKKCGQALTKDQVCSCGATNGVSDTFCKKCGKKLK